MDKKNIANKKHHYDGLYWTYNSAKAFKELFPYWTERQIRSILNKLEEKKIIISGNYNASGYDKTKWYSIIDISILQICNIDVTKWSHGVTETSHRDYQNVRPIPDNKTDTKLTYSKLDSVFPPKNFKNWNLEDFKSDIKLHRGAAEISMSELEAFYDYWRELTASGNMRFQLEKTWETDLRLKTWARRAYSKAGGISHQEKQKQSLDEAAMSLMEKYMNGEA